MTELAHIDQRSADSADSWTPVNLNTLPDQPPIQPNLGGTHLVYPGKRHVFSGPPESAKTLAAYCVLIQNARTAGVGVLIDFEMGAYDARQRLRELSATHDEITRIHYLEPDQPATPERIQRLLNLQPDLVVIDAAAGAYSLEGLDDNKRQDVERIARLYVTAFWRAGTATIFIDHVVKDAETRGRYAIGSERKLGGADVHLGFDTITPISRGTAGRYKITTHKDRGGYLKRGHLADLHLNSDPDTHQIAWSFTEAVTTTTTTGKFRRTGYMERISIILERADEPLSKREAKRRTGGTAAHVDDALDTLIGEGFVKIEQGQNRSTLHSSIRPYRENDESANPKNGSTMPVESHDPSASETTHGKSANLAQPSGDSVIRQWFGSDSANHRVSSDSVIRGSIDPEPPDSPTPPQESPPETLGWFGDNGHLNDTDLAYLEAIAPDPELETSHATTDDTDWTAP